MPRVARIVSVFLGEVDRNPMEICERNGTVGHDFMVPGDFIRLFELIYWKAAGGGRARAGCQTLAWLFLDMGLGFAGPNDEGSWWLCMPNINNCRRVLCLPPIHYDVYYFLNIFELAKWIQLILTPHSSLPISSVPECADCSRDDLRGRRPWVFHISILFPHFDWINQLVHVLNKNDTHWLSHTITKL